MIICIIGQGHITKIATIAKTFKIFSRTRRPMILKLGMKHQAMELYNVYINHDPGKTLTYLRQGQLRLPMHLNRGNCYNLI